LRSRPWPGPSASLCPGPTPLCVSAGCEGSLAGLHRTCSPFRRLR
jgi:hypothetical protein